MEKRKKKKKRILKRRKDKINTRIVLGNVLGYRIKSLVEVQMSSEVDIYNLSKVIPTKKLKICF